MLWHELANRDVEMRCNFKKPTPNPTYRLNPTLKFDKKKKEIEEKSNAKGLFKTKFRFFTLSALN